MTNERPRVERRGAFLVLECEHLSPPLDGVVRRSWREGASRQGWQGTSLCALAPLREHRRHTSISHWSLPPEHALASLVDIADPVLGAAHARQAADKWLGPVILRLDHPLPCL